MKKILLSLSLISILAVLALPVVANAQVEEPELSECCRLRKAIPPHAENDVVGSPVAGAFCKYGQITKPDADWGGFCLMNTIYTVTDWVFFIFIALTVIFVIIGGITFMTAAGDPERTTKGRKFITYAIVGVVIGVLAKAIPAIIRAVIGL